MYYIHNIVSYLSFEPLPQQIPASSMSLFYWNSLDIDIKFDNEESRELIDSKAKFVDNAALAPLFGANDTVSGKVTLRPRNERRVEHSGVKVKFIGTVEQLNMGKVVDSSDFISLTHELAGPDEIRHAETYPFNFKNVDKPYESYNGSRIRLRYYVQVTAFAKIKEPVKERDIFVYHYSPPPPTSHVVSMDVGITGCLHIEFEFAKMNFTLNDTLVGRINFKMVRLKLHHMELTLTRKEFSGAAPNLVIEQEVVTRYEVMEGAPVKGEQVPIRLHLAGFDLVPTMKDVNKKFSVRTFLSVSLVDETGRRYFKQAEINLYRPVPGTEE